VRTALTELLIDLLDKTTDTFLKNTISASLNFYFKENLLVSADKSRLAREISHALDYKEDQRPSGNVQRTRYNAPKMPEAHASKTF